ncbi:MAG: diaminopimelate epimerase [Rhizobiales bacterium]|nr:diaminopimelate epimerase [Hyphomicrobiales bacterium]
MSIQTGIPFVKMNGLGNDFVVVDGRTAPVNLSEDDIRRISNRETGIGCDQFIILEPSTKADLFMRIHNRDGGEVESCGNATRCVASILFAETGNDSASIDTNGGLLQCTPAGDKKIRVDMGRPRFEWQDIPLSEPFADTRAIELQVGPIDAPLVHSPSVVNVGNPHAIFWVDDVEAHDLAGFGPLLEHHPIFPESANISLAQIKSPQSIILRTWERGVGLTSACGTAACAVTVAAARKELTERKVVVTLPGGDLEMEWREDDHIIMTGPYETEFEGIIDDAMCGRVSV